MSSLNKIQISLIVLLLSPCGTFAQNAPDCQKVFLEKKQCPEEMCTLLACPSRDQNDLCQPKCVVKPCVEIDAAHCPLDVCQVLKGCGKSEVCYYQFKYEPRDCGDVGYSGNLECCEGLVKRCGEKFMDGGCDMEGTNTAYSVPICIPCGDHICSQFENSCNCPQDCT